MANKRYMSSRHLHKVRVYSCTNGKDVGLYKVFISVMAQQGFHCWIKGLTFACATLGITSHWPSVNMAIGILFNLTFSLY